MSKKGKKTNKTTPAKNKQNKKKVSETKKKVSETKKTVSKQEVKKAPIKKAEPKKELKDNVNVEEIFKDDVNANKCIHCKKYFEKNLTTCPFCDKEQIDYRGKIVIGILLVILVLSVIGNQFIDRHIENHVSEDEYKFNAKLLSYEELVRQANKYKNTDVKIIGIVTQVEGVDVSKGNVMKVTIDANMFDEDLKGIVTFEYTDKNYDSGFIVGDLVTIYGKYTAINGNIPFIQAKYIVFGS